MDSFFQFFVYADPDFSLVREPSVSYNLTARSSSTSKENVSCLLKSCGSRSGRVGNLLRRRIQIQLRKMFPKPHSTILHKTSILRYRTLSTFHLSSFLILNNFFCLVLSGIRSGCGMICSEDRIRNKWVRMHNTCHIKIFLQYELTCFCSAVSRFHLTANSFVNSFLLVIARNKKLLLVKQRVRNAPPCE